MSSYTINDPIHKMMAFSSQQGDLIRPLIDSAHLQRLRHIKQLGLIELVFPGAVNSRFNHCLGACYLAKRIADQVGLDEERKTAAMVAALLHDVGHGPFSHLFERVLPVEKRLKHDKEWLQCFLNDYEEQGLLPKEITELCYAAFALAPRTDKNSIVADLVSSQLDADRFDYLLRDSHYCGVSYGTFNLDWLLSCMKQVSVDGVMRLGVLKKGVGALEHYIMSRRLMTRNIYANGKVNAVRLYLQTFLVQLSDRVDSQVFSYIKDSVLGQYLQLLHEYKFDRIDKQSFLQQSFPYYKQLIDDDIWLALRQLSQLDIKDDIVELARNIYCRRLPHIMQVSHSEVDRYQEKIADFLHDNPNVRPWQLHLEPLHFVAYEKNSDPIYIFDHKTENVNVKEMSELFEFFMGKSESVCWLYVDRAIKSDFTRYRP